MVSSISRWLPIILVLSVDLVSIFGILNSDESRLLRYARGESIATERKVVKGLRALRRPGRNEGGVGIAVDVVSGEYLSLIFPELVKS